MNVDNYIIACVDAFFSDAKSIMLIGSTVEKTKITAAADIDILILLPGISQSRGILGVEYFGKKIDFTLIPMIDFENYLLVEYFSGSTGIIYCLKHGRIIKDQNSHLKAYKDFATQLYDNRKSVFPYNDSTFNFKVSLLLKLSIDYKARSYESAETYMIFVRLLELVMELELISSTGWNCDGKIKARILEAINPTFIEEIMILIKNSQSSLGKKNIEIHLIDKYLKKFSQVLQNKKTNSYDLNFYYDDILAIEICDEKILLDVVEYCKNNKMKYKSFYSIITTNFINERYNRILFINTNKKFKILIIEFLKKIRREKSHLVKPANYILFDIFNGGKDILQISESFYSYLSNSFLFSSNLDNGHFKDNTTVALCLLMINGSIIGQKNKQDEQFYKYLFDLWFPYAYYSEQLFLQEISDEKKNIIRHFETLNDADNIPYQIFQSVFNKTGEVFSWQKKLTQKVTALHKSIQKASYSYVPEFEEKIAAFYNEDNESKYWFIYRKQLENSFLTLGVPKADWSFFCHTIAKCIAKR